MEKVSVILLNWNGINYVEKCAESVLNQTYKNIEFIIVDNASDDGSIEILKNRLRSYSHVRFILNDVNYGFAKGMNIGIEQSSGAFIMLLNLDVYLDPSYIEKAIERISSDDKTGAIGGIEYRWKEGVLTDQIHVSCGPMYLKKRIQITGKPNIFDEHICFGITGAFPVFRKKMLEDIYKVSGYYFDEDFETGWEDTDMRFRAFLRGWKALYYPQIHAWHVLSASDGGKIKLTNKSKRYQIRIFRNRYFVILKNLPDEIREWLRIDLLLAEMMIYIYYLFLYPSTFISLMAAKKEVKKKTTEMLKKRQRIQSNILIDLNELKRMFIKF